MRNTLTTSRPNKKNLLVPQVQLIPTIKQGDGLYLPRELGTLSPIGQLQPFANVTPPYQNGQRIVRSPIPSLLGNEADYVGKIGGGFTSVTVQIDKDTIVHQFYPDVAFGTQDAVGYSVQSLQVKCNQTFHNSFAYLALSSSALPSSWTTATLYIYQWGNSNGRLTRVGPSDNIWNESTITWNTQPNPHPPLIPPSAPAIHFHEIIGAVVGEVWHTVPLPIDLDIAKGIVLWLEANATVGGLVFASRENGFIRPDGSYGHPYIVFEGVPV